MPLLRIITNVERKDIPDKFLEEITDVLAQAIGKPREVSPIKCHGAKASFSGL
jgi:phenylpyruvate tautomerase PptA (4-oxalocrotonate tautomerase family)